VPRETGFEEGRGFLYQLGKKKRGMPAFRRKRVGGDALRGKRDVFEEGQKVALNHCMTRKSYHALAQKLAAHTEDRKIGDTKEKKWAHKDKVKKIRRIIPRGEEVGGKKRRRTDKN